MDIDFNDYQEIDMLHREEAYAKASELLGLSPASDALSLEKQVNDYIDDNYMWYCDNEEYRYMGHDCGDCYMGGDVKEAVVCGDYLVLYAKCPTYRIIRIFKKKQ